MKSARAMSSSLAEDMPAALARARVSSLRPSSEVRTVIPLSSSLLPTAAPMAPGAITATTGVMRTSLTGSWKLLQTSKRLQKSGGTGDPCTVICCAIEPRIAQMPPCSAGKAYGTVSPERQKQMSGLEFVQGLANGSLPLNTMAETLRYDVTEAESGRVVVTAVPDRRHLNPAGTVHGGLAATMLDSCMGLAIHSTLDKGVGSTTLEFKI